MKLRQTRPPVKLTNGQQILLHELWYMHGGLRKAALKIGVPEHQLNVWRQRGRVPLKYVRLISDKLAAPMAAINYADMFTIEGAHMITWESAVKKCGFSEFITARILKAKPPMRGENERRKRKVQK